MTTTPTGRNKRTAPPSPDCREGGTCRPKCRECSRYASLVYHRANKHVSWAGGYRARAKFFGLEPVVEHFTKADVIRVYGDACAYCPSGEFEELDHLIPVCKGGHHTLSNVRPACMKCNEYKARTDGCPDDRRVP